MGKRKRRDKSTKYIPSCAPEYEYVFVFRTKYIVQRVVFVGADV